MRDWYLSLGPLELLGYSVGASILLQWILTQVVLRMARKTKTNLDETIVLSVRLPILLTLLFVGIYFSLKRVDPALLDSTLFRTRAVLVTIAAFVWMKALRKVGDAICDALARRADEFQWIQPQSVPIYEILSGLLVIGVGIYAILLAWDIDLTAWLASAGIIGIAVGFAARDTLANLFAGVFILADSPYRIGDYVVLDSGERGKVTDIGIRSTRMITRDDVEVTIPNALMGNSKIYNETGGPHDKFRIRIPLMVCYGEDLDKVRATLMDVATSNPQVCSLPEPRVRYRSFADSGVTLEMLCWVDEPVLRGIVTDRLVVQIHTRFGEENIVFPYPRQELFLTQVPASPGADG